MAIITTIINQASVTYESEEITSNQVETTLLLAPTILKAVDKLTASIGEILTYTITITNLGLNPISDLPFSDIIPAGAEYVEDSFTLNSVTETPTLTDDLLTFTIPSIGGSAAAVISFQVEVVGGEE